MLQKERKKQADFRPVPLYSRSWRGRVQLSACAPVLSCSIVCLIARIDTAELKRALPEIAAAFTRETTVRRFCVA